MRRALLGFGLLALAGSAWAAGATCVTSQCHATLLTKRVVHPPTEGCDGCHESTATPHPQKGRKTFKLLSEPPEMCVTCHDAVGTKADVHPPAKEGMCTTCHDPHASDQDKLLVRPAAELCTDCHADKTGLAHMHGPAGAGDCAACHAPHESDIKPLLLKKDDELCAGCHVDIGEQLKKRYVHGAVQGGCVSCHNPHGSEHPKLLADEGTAVCVTCHADVGEKVDKGPTVHPALKGDKGCVSCHSPHAADSEHLLLAPQKDTCLGCHKTIVPQGAAVVHAPVAQGACTKCHDPHAGAARLLLAGFPEKPYVPYTGDAYALCFTCHKREMLQYPDTSFATGFRDGERNLHFLHVNNKQKGRSCALCHEIHAGRSPKLIADAVPFGSWRLPIKFAKTDTGGSCAPGCHKPQTYDRKRPAK
jgi:predicted CXXCH cytochrome family protein